MERFEGLIPPMITPFRDGKVDGDGIAALVDHTVAYLDGMVVGGSCGEGPSMSRAQRKQALAAFVEAVDNRVPVIAGVSGTSLETIAEHIADAERAGVAGFLVPAPYYFSNSPAALRSFFRNVARSTELPVMVYDNPQTTKTAMSPELLTTIVSDNPTINHVKVTDTDIDKIPALIERCDATLLAGSDDVMHHQVLRGCAGAITATPEVFPQASRRWFDAARAGEADAGRDHYDRLLPLIIELLLGPDQYPAVVKHALARLGVLASAEVLPPLTPLDDTRRAEIDMVLARHAVELAT